VFFKGFKEALRGARGSLLPEDGLLDAVEIVDSPIA
jgi:hypothetical protein